MRSWIAIAAHHMPLRSKLQQQIVAKHHLQQVRSIVAPTINSSLLLARYSINLRLEESPSSRWSEQAWLRARQSQVHSKQDSNTTWLETWNAFHEPRKRGFQPDQMGGRQGPLRVPHTSLLLTYVPYLVTAVSRTRHHHC
jgi:hypothetical protein